MNRGFRTRRWLLAGALACAILGASASQAQIIDGTSYVFTESTGATLEDMTGSTKLIGMGADDTLSGIEPIGFDFWFNGQRYNTFYAGSNGAMFLGGVHSTNHTAYGVGQTSDAPTIAVLGDDLLLTAPTGSVSYKVTGTAPNRKLVVQWSGLRIPYSFSDTALTNSSPQTNSMQAILSEGSGTIELVYGDGIVANPNGAGIGISSGTLPNQYASVTVGAPSTVSYTAVNNINTLAIASGTKFTFTPRAATPPTLGVVTATGTSITLNWTDTLSGFFGTAVYISEDGGTTYRFLQQVPGGTTALTVSGLGNASTYHFRLHGVTEGGVSAGVFTGPIATTPGSLSGTIPVGASSPLTNLTAALAAIAGNGLAGNVRVELQADYNPATETYPLVMPVQGGPGARITITPATGAGPFTLTSANGADPTANSLANNTVLFNGASYITIDGGASKAITIQNTANTSNPNVAAVLFVNDSRNNTLTNVNLRGSGVRSFTTNDNAVVQFRGTTGVRGNDDNTVSNSVIGPAGVNLPQTGILSVNTTVSLPAYNDRLTLSGNEISDYFEAGTVNRGVFIGQGTDATTISNNKIFQTGSRTFTSGNIHSGIHIDNGGTTFAHGLGHTVSGNTIGYASNAATGTWTYGGTVATRFIGVHVPNSYGTTVITGNTVSNVSLATSSGATGFPGNLAGITYGTTLTVNNGRVTVTNNVVGATTADDQLVATTTTSGGMMGGILVTSSGIATVENNVVRGLTGLGSGTNVGVVVRALTVIASRQYSGNDHFVRNNTVGVDPSLSLQNIRGSGTGTGNVLVFGVNGTLTPPNRGEVFCENNTVQSLFANSPASTGGRVIGIELLRGYQRVNNNTVRGLTATAPNAAGTEVAAVIGITAATYNSATPTANDRSWGSVVSGNSISNLRYNPTNPATNGSIHGLLYSYNAPPTGATQAIRLFNNRVTDLTSTSTGAVVLNGMYNFVQSFGATVDTYNNFVSLGTNALGGNIAIFAYRHNGNVGQNYWHNSAFIGGTTTSAGSGPTAAYLRAAVPASVVTDLRNNIWANERSNGPSTGQHFSVFYNNGTNPTVGLLSSTNNNYWGNGAGYFTGAANGLALQTVADLQAQSGTDTAAIAANPGYADGPANDLHITDCFAGAGLGTTIAAVMEDIDGNARPAAPDMGADEITEVPAFPTAQGSSVAVTQTDCDTLDVSWIAAPSVDGYVVVRRIGGAPTGAPSVFRATQYSVSDTIGDGTVVFVGSGTSFSDSGLVSGDNANYAVFSFNGGSCFRYLAAAPATGSATVVGGDPAAQPTNLTSPGQTTSSIDVSWDPASPVPTGYIVLAILGTTPPSDVPVDGVTYAVNDPIGASTVVYVGTGTSFSHTGLPAETDYAYAVFSFDSTSGCTSYLTTAPLTGTFSTAPISTVSEWNTIE